MGSGFKNWTVNEILTSPDVNGYLMRQTIPVFASAAARNAALTGSLLEDGQHTYLTNEDAITVYEGTGNNWYYVYKGWESYTPTVAGIPESATYNLSFAYAYTSRGELRVKGVLTFVAAAAITGNVTFTLPNNDQQATAGISWGHCKLRDADPLTTWNGSSECVSTLIRVYAHNTSGNLVNPSSSFPFNWANDDQIYVDISLGCVGLST